MPDQKISDLPSGTPASGAKFEYESGSASFHCDLDDILGDAEMLHSHYTNVGTSSGSEVALGSVVIPANSIEVGDQIDFEYSGSWIASGRSRGNVVRLNGVNLGGPATTNSSESNWHIKGHIARTGASTAVYWIRYEWINTSGRMAWDGLGTNVVSSGLDWTADQTLALMGWGGGVTDDTVLQLAKVIHLKKP